MSNTSIAARGFVEPRVETEVSSSARAGAERRFRRSNSPSLGEASFPDTCEGEAFRPSWKATWAFPAYSGLLEIV